MTSPQTIAQSMSCLRPIDKDGLVALSEKGKANPQSVVTLKAKTVCEGQFRMQTYVRDLAPMLIDEPPHLLGENNAPNPSEAVLAALGAWMGWQMLPVIILLSSAVGAVVGITLILVRGRDRNIPIPFGPYLAAAGWIALLWGHDISSAYLRFSGMQ